MDQTTRKTRWGLRAGLAAVLVVWLLLAGIGGPTVGRLSEVQENDNANFLPKQAESTQVNQEAAKFVDSAALPYFVVIQRDSGITPADRAKAAEFLAAVPKLELLPGEKPIGDYLAAPARTIIPSQDGKALMLVIELNGDRAAEVVTEGETVLFAVADTMRTEIKESLIPTGLQVYVTGPGGVFADFVVAFGGIDGILLGVALAVVFVILLIVYRSPILPVRRTAHRRLRTRPGRAGGLSAGRERRDRR